MNQDEMSGKQIKTVIGVREEDLIVYANEVQREIAEKAKVGVVENSKYDMPKSREEIVEEKEPFVMGDNEYSEFTGVINKTNEGHKLPEQPIQKRYDLEELKEIINKEYNDWKTKKDPVVDRYKTIDAARQNRFQQNSTVCGIYGISAKDGNVVVDRCETSSDQKRLLNSMQLRSQEIARSIEGQIQSKYGNYLMYATNDFCDLEMIDKLLPNVEERLRDLESYEKRIGRFSTVVIEGKTVKKNGIRGLFGAKDIHYSQRRLTDEELAKKKESDIIKLNISLAEGEIDRGEYEKLCESVERLYGGELQIKKVEKVSNEKLEEMKREFHPKVFATDTTIVQKIQKEKQQQNSSDESGFTLR